MDNSPSTYTIRLRGPCALFLMRNGTQQDTARVQIPCKIVPELLKLTANFETDVLLLKRTFNKPTGLEPSQRVTLEFSGFEGAIRLVINRESAVELEHSFDQGNASVDVTESLMNSNVLEVEFDSPESFAGEVRLVIEG